MIRFGIIGTNWITDEFIRAASMVEDFKLTAVYSRTEEKAKEFARKYDVEDVFTNIEDMAKSDLIDAVYIASPNSFHKEQSIIFLSAGKHVLCEKPIASNPLEIEEMFSVAKKNNVLLMEALKTTLMPNFLAIQRHLHKIGTVRKFFANYCQYSSRYDAYKNGTVLNAFNPTFSNGSLMDLGIYCVYPIVVLFGEPKGIQANAIMLDSGVDGAGSLVLDYGEFEATVSHSKINHSYIPSEIQGEEGSMIIDHISTPENIEIRYRNGQVEKISQPLDRSSMYYEVEEFIKLINVGKYESEVNSFEHTLTTSRILQEARKQFGLVYPADKKG